MCDCPWSRCGVSELVSLFQAMQVREGIAAEVGVPGDVHANALRTGGLGGIETETAAGELETSFVEERNAMQPHVGCGNAQIMVLLLIRATVGTLARHLAI